MRSLSLLYFLLLCRDAVQQDVPAAPDPRAAHQAARDRRHRAPARADLRQAEAPAPRRELPAVVVLARAAARVRVRGHVHPQHGAVQPRRRAAGAARAVPGAALERLRAHGRALLHGEHARGPRKGRHDRRADAARRGPRDEHGLHRARRLLDRVGGRVDVLLRARAQVQLGPAAAAAALDERHAGGLHLPRARRRARVGQRTSQTKPNRTPICSHVGTPLFANQKRSLSFLLLLSLCCCRCMWSARSRSCGR